MERGLILCAFVVAVALQPGPAPASDNCLNGVTTRLPDRLQAMSGQSVTAEPHAALRNPLAPEWRRGRRDREPDPPAVGTIAFAMDQRLFVEDPVFGLAAGDLNGDARLDFITVSWDSASLSVLIGAPGGAYEQPVEFKLPSWPSNVATGDLDGDGADEAVVPMFYADQLAIVCLEGGAPTIAQIVGTGPGPTACVVSDFDGDGHPDVAVSNWWDNTLNVFRNAGDGTLEAPATYLTGMGPDNPIALDLDGDGDLDIVTADAGCLSVSALLNRGDGTFRPRVTTIIPGNVSAVAAGDLDGDGDSDLAAVSYSDVLLLENIGGCRFKLQARLNPREYNCTAPGIADFDGDGRLDVVVTTFGSSYPSASHQKLAIYMNEGGWTFASAVDYATGYRPRRLLVHDIDDDGISDIVTGNAGSGNRLPITQWWPSVSILYGRRDGTLGSFADIALPSADAYHSNYDVVNSVSSVHPVSFGRRERPQIVVGRYWSSELVEDLGGNRFRITEIVPGPILAALDVNGDGISDLLAGRPSPSDTIDVWLGARDRTFSHVARYVGNRFATTLDFDGKGRPDIVVFDASDTLMLRRNLGGGTFGELENLGVRFEPGMDFSVAGRNLDGKRGDELLISRDTYRGVDSVAVWINQHGKHYVRGEGTPLHPEPGKDDYVLWCQKPKYFGFGDVNNDGIEDALVLATSYDEGGYLAVLANDGRGRLTLVHFNKHVGTEPTGLAVDDFDHDGWADAAIADAATGFAGRLAIYQGVGAGQFEPVATYFPGDYPVGITGADIDGNGTTDLALVTRRNGLLVRVMNGGPPPAPVRLLATVESTTTDAGVVRIEWNVPGLDAAVVERATRGWHWEPIGDAESLGAGRFRVVDTEPDRGRTGYRLAATRSCVEVKGSEVWVRARSRGRLVVHDTQLASGQAGLQVELGLEHAGPVLVEMFDVAGRRVLARRVNWMAAGMQAVRLPGLQELEQGLYWVRVRQAGEEARAKVVLVR